MKNIRGDARTRCFTPSFESGQVPVLLGEQLAQAFSDLYSNVGDVDDVVEQLWHRADDALADLLQELWKRSPDDSAEVLAKAVQKHIDAKLPGLRELRKALAVYRGEE